ncbi:MAG: UDP-N-acetylmuramyl-tripeptide synthetase, partial [Clostridia bacterium]|nr:UDP-N-acetylmuramyl-tripeptide synthetase [Clostridia bacterium]
GEGSAGAGTEAGSGEARPDAWAEAVRAGATSLAFSAVGRPGGPFAGLRQRVTLPIGGRFNVANALAALLAAAALGVAPDKAARALEEASPVPGRFERIEAGQPFAVLVDYAHTPDGLANVLRAAREVTAGRLLVVFGCGGDRDRGKRPEMGRIAAEAADVVVLTSDNPRSEDPERILDEIAAGVPSGCRAEVRREADRRKAIAAALSLAAPDDTVVIAGKGHETVQIFRDRTVPFDDREVAREELRRLGWGGPAWRM